MNKSRFSYDEIDRVLYELQSGNAARDIAQRHGVSVQTLYRWKTKYGVQKMSDLRHLRDLEEENRELKRQLAAANLDNEALKKLLTSIW